jgi:hypothetical protein
LPVQVEWTREQVQRVASDADEVVVPASASSGLLTETVSPELVLVDPGLAARAREQVDDPDDTLSRVRARAVSAGDAGSHASMLDDDIAQAVRRLAESALDGQAQESAAQRPRRVRRPVTVAAAVSAMFALALAVADRQLESADAPATAETTAAVEAPATADLGGSGAELGSSAGATGTAPAPAPRRFAWAPTEGASGYHVELFRGTSRVFAEDTRRPEIVIPAKWTLGGRQYRLEPVAYRWYVWPVVSGRRTSRAVVQARLVVRDR